MRVLLRMMTSKRTGCLSMKVICSYCHKEMGETDGPGPPSHGMCEECLEYFTRQWAGLKLGEYLDGFDVPIAAVDGDARIISWNDKMAAIIGRPREEASGLLCGEAMECHHARLPGGCGRTAHCKTCAIRNSIEHTVDTGEPCHNVPATLSAESNEIVRGGPGLLDSLAA
mgnify:CR=1 FL=1